MLYTAFLLLISNAFMSLRLGDGNTGTFPRPLSAKEESENVERWVKSGDLDARNRLVEHNLRLVAHIIKKYYTQTTDYDDLISIGTVGLIKGVSTYRPDKNVRLATYASRCIENAILSQRKTPGWPNVHEKTEESGYQILSPRFFVCAFRLQKLFSSILLFQALYDGVGKLKLLLRAAGELQDAFKRLTGLKFCVLPAKLILLRLRLWKNKENLRCCAPFMRAFSNSMRLPGGLFCGQRTLRTAGAALSTARHKL